MIRNKAPRYRNLQNLHVIPTAPTVSVVPFVQPVSNVLITVQPTTSIPQTPITLSQNTSDKNFQNSMYSQNKLRNKRPRRRNRKRKGVDRFSSMQTLVPNKNYNWYDPNYLNQESSSLVDNIQENIDDTVENIDDAIENTDKTMNINSEEAENDLEAPVEEDFEEVEVASVDGVDDAEADNDETSAGEASMDADGKQEILVGFRTSKIHYLRYKNNCFFKPKVYNFSSQRTFVNCLNIQDNCSVDVDVVSEADYEIEYEGEVLDQNESQDYIEKVETERKDDDASHLEMKNDSNTMDKKTKEKNTIVKTVKNDCKVKSKDIKEIKNLDHNSAEEDLKSDVKTVKNDHKLESKNIKEIKNLDHKNSEINIKSDVKLMKTSSSIDPSSVKPNFNTNVKTKVSNSMNELCSLNQVSELEVKSKKSELIAAKNQNKNDKSEVNQFLESSAKNEFVQQRIYKASVENKDIQQGKCAIQSILDSWESHLIGLEYLIEIQNNTNSPTMYNCILCSEDIEAKEFSSENVISHINGRKHVVKYLEKHFPSCGLKFCNSSDYNFLVLQKICEEVNAKLGYFYMCITNFDFYKNHKKEMINIVQNSSHFSEENLKLNINVFGKEVESNFLKDLKNVVNCLVEKTVKSNEASERNLNEPKESEKTLNVHKKVADSGKVGNKSSYYDKKKMLNTYQKCKGNSSLTSFLKLKYAKTTFKGSKPAKGPSTKAVMEKNTEIVSAVKKSTVIGAAKEIPDVIICGESKNNENIDTKTEKNTVMISAKKENTEILDVKKGKNISVIGAKQESTEVLDVKKAQDAAINITKKEIAAEEEMFIKEDSVLEPTKPVFQTGILDQGEESDSSIKVIEIKDKDVSMPTTHSKHCRKRILGKDSRFKVAAKIKTKEGSLLDCFREARAKNVPVSEYGNKSSLNKLAPKKDIDLNEHLVTSSNKKYVSKRVTSIPFKKNPRENFKSLLNKYSKISHPKVAHKRENETPPKKIDILVAKDASKWKPVTSTPKTPISSSSSKPSHALKVGSKHSPIPVQKSSVERIVRDLSRSPIRRIKSPLKIIHRSPVRKLHRSPVKRHSRSPFRRNSRSPYRKLSKSPRRKSRSPKRHRSRSTLRQHSRSPLRRYSRSPLRRYSRSPMSRHSRSPNRRRSRSPNRRQSRSPIRRHSRSPFRRHSRSPFRRHSKSPMSRYSRSPIKWHSRSPSRRHSRSPRRRYSKSPGRQQSFSPIRRPLSPIKRHRSPVTKLSRSFNRNLSKSPVKEYRNIYKTRSPSLEHSDSIKHRMMSGKRDKYNLEKRLGSSKKEYVKIRTTKQSVSSISDKHKSHSFASSSARGISDLDPVSDEDESIYFDKQQQHLVEDIMTSSSSKAVQFLQKFAISNPNLDPSTIKKMMQFFESHKDELQQMMGSTSTSKIEKINKNRQITANIQENILQQLLLSSLAGSSRESGSSSASNLMPKYEHHQYLAENISSGYGLMPNVSPHNLPQYSASQIFPPNVNMPPPQVYGQLNQPHQEFLQKTPPQNEGLFKDIKVTINKLFGANEMTQKQENIKSAVPGYVYTPDPEKWDLNHPATPKFSPQSAPNFSGHLNTRFNTPIDQKNIYQTESKNMNFNDASRSSVMRPDMPAMFNRNTNIPGQYKQAHNLPVPPPDAKVSFCEVSRSSSKSNLFPVVQNQPGNTNFSSSSSHAGVSDVKVSLAQRLASVLVKVGMTDVPAPLLQEMLMKIGAFSSLPRQDITEAEIISILRRLGYLS